jgi:hypothetical protein
VRILTSILEAAAMHSDQSVEIRAESGQIMIQKLRC